MSISKRLKGIAIVCLMCIGVQLGFVPVQVMASEQDHDVLFREMVEKIEEYSYFENGDYKLSHEIVKDKVITQQQYDDAEKIAKIWTEHMDNQKSQSGGRVKRALPVFLIPALKAAAVLVGGVAAERIINDFMTWGMKSGCNAWKSNKYIKSFCKANGYA